LKTSFLAATYTKGLKGMDGKRVATRRAAANILVKIREKARFRIETEGSYIRFHMCKGDWKRG
jgi:hypothetical protein